MSSDAFTVSAYAKINVTLEVLGKRADGYHALRSVVMPVSLADTVTVSRTPRDFTVTVACEPPVDPASIGPDNHNLALRAARAFTERFQIPGGVAVALTKRIPVGGGLGGGSADAAAVLRALNSLCHVNAGASDLATLGATVGSDVPALTHGGAVVMEGRGEHIRPLFTASTRVARPLWLVLANPGVHCATVDIFHAWQPAPDANTRVVALDAVRDALATGDEQTLAGLLLNDLETAAYAKYPEIRSTAQALTDAGCLGVRMSGSGASVFGLVRDAAHGAAVCAALPTDVWRTVVQMLPSVETHVL